MATAASSPSEARAAAAPEAISSPSTTLPSSSATDAYTLPPITSSSPVEMDALPAKAEPIELPANTPLYIPEAPDTVAGASRTADQDPSSSTLHSALTQQSEALGPATDLPTAALAPPPPTQTTGPILSITLMLTTGARHPYKIDEKYLKSRKVDSLLSTADGKFDPRHISGYKLKELIWTDWRAEWEPRPASPSSIRLIILGRMVEDKSALKDFPFKLNDTNVVHMTVKPADFLDDDDTGGKTGKGHSIRGRDDGEQGAGCRCVIL